jgi:hypothetical protein
MELLEQQLAVTKAELRLASKRAEELTEELDAQRSLASDEHRQWAGELREMRKLMELAMQARGAVGASEDGEPPREDAEGVGDAAARVAELRLRANSRRAAQRRPG